MKLSKQPKLLDKNVMNVPGNQNKPSNQDCIKLKKEDDRKIQSQSNIDQVVPKCDPITSYRVQSNSSEKEERKWNMLEKFNRVSSKLHYIFNLKWPTIFLSMSLAEKTVAMILEEKIYFDQWMLCCLYLPMKYEEIYPPTLKDVNRCAKTHVNLKLYLDEELKVLEYINVNLNFVSLNTYLSQYLHATEKHERLFIFYLLEIAQSIRGHLKQYSEKELVLSVMYILSFHHFTLENKEKIDGIPFERIERCAIQIILVQMNCSTTNHFLYKKYNSQKMNFVSSSSIEPIRGITNLLATKINKEASIPKIGFCKKRNY